MKRNQVHGLMVGITIGFAFWGRAQAGAVGDAQEVRMRAAVEENAVADVWAAEMAVPLKGMRVSAKETAVLGVSSAETDVPSAKTGEPAEKTAVPASGMNVSEDQYLGIMQAAAETDKKQVRLYAQSAVLMDGDNGRILYEKEGDVFRSMASTTKIMTCILALEKGKPSEICTVSETAAAQPKVHLGAGKGTRFYLKDLLYSLMLESHNDSAVMIAEQIGGSVEGFADMMNEKARELGCKNTCFLTPNGLDRTYRTPEGKEYVHGTTAEDLAAVMRYCIKESPRRKEFLEITRTSGYAFTDVEGKHSFSCVNHNALLSMMEGLLTGKTGFTDKAGYSYVAALEDEGRTYILVLLGSGWPPHKTYKWADARALFDYGKENYHFQEVYREPELEKIPVLDGIPVTGEAPEAGEDSKTASLPSEAAVWPVLRLKEEEKHFQIPLSGDEKVEPVSELPHRLSAPVKERQQIGAIHYVLEGKILRTDPVYADRTVPKIDWKYCAEQLWERFWRLNLAFQEKITKTA